MATKVLTEYEVLHRERLLIGSLFAGVDYMSGGGYWCRKHGALFIDSSGCPCLDSSRCEYLDEDELIHALLQVILTGQKGGGC